jgi:hypothetical protein
MWQTHGIDSTITLQKYKQPSRTPETTKKPTTNSWQLTTTRHHTFRITMAFIPFFRGTKLFLMIKIPYSSDVSPINTQCSNRLKMMNTQLFNGTISIQYRVFIAFIMRFYTV